jgi:hypothetical protein
VLVVLVVIIPMSPALKEIRRYSVPSLLLAADLGRTHKDHLQAVMVVLAVAETDLVLVDWAIHLQ